MQLFEDLIKCKDCMNNINNKCILYPGKDTKEENTGCYVGIDRNNKQKLVGGALCERKDICIRYLSTPANLKRIDTRKNKNKPSNAMICVKVEEEDE